MKKYSPVRIKYFALGELILVVAILFLWASWLQPLWGKAVPRYTCVNNLKQISHALQAYTQDYKGYYPGYFATHAYDPFIVRTTGKNGEIKGLGTLIKLKYINDPKVISCPNNPRTEAQLTTADFAPQRDRLLNKLLQGYFYHARNGWNKDWTALYSTTKIVGNRAIVGDVYYTKQEDALADSHNGTYNILYGDGAVKSLKFALPLTDFIANKAINQVSIEQRLELFDNQR